jgi:4-amino-4-deoxy-L-arabinose transferase-like glycosyltransferase
VAFGTYHGGQLARCVGRSERRPVVAKSQRGTWWFFVLLILLLVLVWYGAAAVSTSACSEDSSREWQWFPPKWECPRRL